MAITKRNTFYALLAAALLSTLACSATPPTGPSSTLAAVTLVPIGDIGYWTLGREHSALAYAVDSRGVYTDVTTQASWSSAFGRVAITMGSTPITSFARLRSGRIGFFVTTALQ